LPLIGNLRKQESPPKGGLFLANGPWFSPIIDAGSVECHCRSAVLLRKSCASSCKRQEFLVASVNLKGRSCGPFPLPCNAKFLLRASERVAPDDAVGGEHSCLRWKIPGLFFCRTNQSGKIPDLFVCRTMLSVQIPMLFSCRTT